MISGQLSPGNYSGLNPAEKESLGCLSGGASSLSHKPIAGIGMKKEAFQPNMTLASINPLILNFKAMEYAARGPVILRTMEIESEMRQVGTDSIHIFLELKFLQLLISRGFVNLSKKLSRPI